MCTENIGSVSVYDEIYPFGFVALYGVYPNAAVICELFMLVK